MLLEVSTSKTRVVIIIKASTLFNHLVSLFQKKEKFSLKITLNWRPQRYSVEHND